MTTFDDILEEAGHCGFFQKRIFSLLCLISVPFAGVYVGIVFLGFTPKHWCRNPMVKEVQMYCDWSVEESLRVTMPFQDTSFGAVRSQCEGFDMEWNITHLSCDDLEGEIAEAKRAALPTSACKDGWDYDYEGRESFVTEVCWKWLSFCYSLIICSVSRQKYNKVQMFVHLLSTK